MSKYIKTENGYERSEDIAAVWHEIGSQYMDGVEKIVRFTANGETVVRISVIGAISTTDTTDKAYATIYINNFLGRTAAIPLISVLSPTANHTFLIVGDNTLRTVFYVIGSTESAYTTQYATAMTMFVDPIVTPRPPIYGPDKLTDIAILFDMVPASGTLVRMEGI